ncbi:MAG TPA: ATP synthase F0 subunit C [Verrucomicrobiae bacterium]|jgi:F-type H+-transporting ATPase subunit c
MLADAVPTIANTDISHGLGLIKTGIAMAGASVGIGCATAGALIAMSRNPGMTGRILLWMFIGMALAEGWAVIAWFVVK